MNLTVLAFEIILITLLVSLIVIKGINIFYLLKKEIISTKKIANN